MQKPTINKNSLYAICSDYMATTLIKIAEFYPESKDAFMDEVLADPRAVVIVGASLSHLKSDIFDLCKAYPRHTFILLQKLAPQIQASNALSAFKLIDKEFFKYSDFVAVFPQYADELFGRGDVFDVAIPSVFVLQEIINNLAQYKIPLLDQLLKQSDARWRQFFSSEWQFLDFAQHCPERRDALFSRYFSLCSDDSQVTFEKLLALTIRKDGGHGSPFSLGNLDKLIKLFPEYKSRLFERLFNDPEIVFKFFLQLDAPKELECRFLDLLNMATEYKANILAALQKLPTVSGVLGGLAHEVIDLAGENHAWWNHDVIIRLCDHLPELAESFVQKIFTNKAVLAKILSHPTMKFCQAFELAIRFPQFKQEIINAIQFGNDAGPNFNVSDAIIETAHDDLKPVLKVLQQMSRSDSDFEKQALFYQLLACPDLIQLSLQYIQDNAAVETLNLYADTPLPTEMWPWLNLLISSRGENLFKLCCQLFPDYSVELVKFCLKNELFREVFVKDVDNIIAAVTMAPELKAMIIASLSRLGACHEKAVDKLFAAFPEYIPEILALLFKENFGYFGDFIDFAHRYPQHLTVLVKLLKSHPEKFLEILSSSRDIYPLFVLFPNRRLLVEAFCIGAKMSEDKLALLNNFATALAVLPEFIKHFLIYLFEIPKYPQVFCSYSVSQSLSVLYGHEKNVLLLLCSFPLVVETLKFVGDQNQLREIFDANIKALINCCHAIFHDALSNQVNRDLDIRHIKSAYCGCIVKFIERLIEAAPKNLETLVALQELRSKVACQSIPRLQFIAHAVVAQAGVDVLPEELVENASEEYVDYVPSFDQLG